MKLKYKKPALLVWAALANMAAAHGAAADKAATVADAAPEAADEAGATAATAAKAAEAGARLPAQVVVSGAAIGHALDRAAPTASRLGLTVADTPATVNAIEARTMALRGLHSAERAIDSMPGVSSGGAPGSPSQFSMRGFAGNQVTILRDGIYLGPADMTYRSQNTFNLASIEVLKGPGSVL